MRLLLAKVMLNDFHNKMVAGYPTCGILYDDRTGPWSPTVEGNNQLGSTTAPPVLAGRSVDLLPPVVNF